MPVSHTVTDGSVEGPEPFELLRRLELLRSLDDTTLEAVVEGVEPVRLQDGQVLVRQGELDDALYAVASGTLRAVTVSPSSEEKILDRYGPGGVLGEIQLVLGGAWTATIEAESPCRLYRLPRAVLDGLSDREGEILEPLVWIVRSRMGRAQLAEVLPRFLGPLGPRELDALEQQVQSVTVRRGEALFRQGDPADGWFIVMSGRLQVLRRDELGDLKTLGELGIPIDMVGGTSMGAVIAAQVALGLSREEMVELNLRFMSRRPFAQYTVPMVAMLNARRLQEGMQMAVGETRIEDLWINYFAVSTNLTTTEMVVHDRGPVWEAVRASVSLPGILPPFVQGLHLLADGGVINNLAGRRHATARRGVRHRRQRQRSR